MWLRLERADRLEKHLAQSVAVREDRFDTRDMRRKTRAGALEAFDALAKDHKPQRLAGAATAVPASVALRVSDLAATLAGFQRSRSAAIFGLLIDIYLFSVRRELRFFRAAIAILCYKPLVAFKTLRVLSFSTARLH